MGICTTEFIDFLPLLSLRVPVPVERHAAILEGGLMGKCRAVPAAEATGQ